jgi:hypothetical protein
VMAIDLGGLFGHALELEQKEMGGQYCVGD